MPNGSHGDSKIGTARLSLVLIPEPTLSASLEDRDNAASLAGFAIPGDWFVEREIIQLRRDQLRADPTYAPWGPRAIVLRAIDTMIGHIGFHTRPNPDYLHPHGPDAIEFGYTVFPAHRRNGYAAEAVGALMHWAVSHAAIQTFVLSIAPDNTPSQALARRLGFTKVGEHVDEKDGLEEVLILRNEQVPTVNPVKS